ncbi:MAG TPA: hypothetical protein VFP44_07780 [Usitatibacter sp.]|nr:hypothetical protein [Usitatibacter sp.]
MIRSRRWVELRALYDDGSGRATGPGAHEEWEIAMRRAEDARAVIEIVLLAVSRIPHAELRKLPAQHTPRRLHSREDVEHWARRMEVAADMAQPARSAMRQILHAALARLDEIGPARRRRDA